MKTDHETIEKITSIKLRALPIDEDRNVDDTDFYSEREIELLLEDDEISPEESGFMIGYLGED